MAAPMMDFVILFDRSRSVIEEKSLTRSDRELSPALSLRVLRVEAPE